MTPELQAVLDRLQSVGKTGPDQFEALCPAHDDQKPSLSVGLGRNGKPILRCHAGCEVPDILKAAGLTWSDICGHNGRRPPRSVKRTVAATYRYRNAQGELLFEVVRYAPKDFRQRRPDGRGGWTWNVKGVERVLYRLPELLNAPLDACVFIVEGEKDCDGLVAVGCVATTNPGGALKWKDLSDDSALHGRRVAIIPDRDEKGRGHAVEVAAALHGKAETIKIVGLPGDGVKDASDWLAQRRGDDPAETRAELLALVDAAEAVESGPTTCDAPSEAGNPEPASSGSKESQASALVALAAEAELFHTAGAHDAEGYATLEVNGHRETWPISGKAFRRWLAGKFYAKCRKAPGSQALQDATNVLTAKALYDGPERPTAVRLAEYGGHIYLDLADADWHVVGITPAGWCVIGSSESPIRFTRKRGMLPLPLPERGGRVDELRPLVNLPTDTAWTLYVAWLLAALSPRGPYPILIVNGEQGSAKSCLCRVARDLIDPNMATLRRPPRDDRDLLIAATNGHVLAFDNLSGVRPELSDAICAVATRGGFATRELYSDGEEKLFDAARPVLLNGIDELATRPDLLDRAVVLTLPAIPPSDRREERGLWERFERIRPRVLGALLDAVSTALANRDRIKLGYVPRMADFAVWVMAAEPALGWPTGAFMTAYVGNRDEANSAALEASPVAPPIINLLEGSSGSWKGTASELLAKLESGHTDETTHRRRDWPGTPKAMGNALRRIAPSLRMVGIEVELGDREGKERRRVIRITRRDKRAAPQQERAGDPASAPSAWSATPAGATETGFVDEDSGRSQRVADDRDPAGEADRPPQNRIGDLETRLADEADEADGREPARPNAAEVGCPDGAQPADGSCCSDIPKAATAVDDEWGVL